MWLLVSFFSFVASLVSGTVLGLAALGLGAPSAHIVSAIGPYMAGVLFCALAAGFFHERYK